ncbi:MAG: hypothetical protein K2Q34_07050 [Alphaproteobacteria bacterium]|nr:hypothetical protein [Alphaproteobacteria bacterium]
MNKNFVTWETDNEITGALYRKIREDLLIPEVLLQNFVELPGLPTEIKATATKISMKKQTGNLTWQEIVEFGALLNTHRHRPKTLTVLPL